MQGQKPMNAVIWAKTNIIFSFGVFLAATQFIPECLAEPTVGPEPLLLPAGRVRLIDRESPPRFDKCLNCHMRKDRPVLPRTGKPTREHGDISNVHGTKQVSCHNCHDPNNSNFLRSYDRFSADFRNPSTVCATCHATTFEKWREGLHGKRTSGKNGIREQFHCVNCHSPHSVTFQQMHALPPPKRPKFFIDKHEGEDTDHRGEKPRPKEANP